MSRRRKALDLLQKVTHEFIIAVEIHPDGLQHDPRTVGSSTDEGSVVMYAKGRAASVFRQTVIRQQ